MKPRMAKEWGRSFINSFDFFSWTLELLEEFLFSMPTFSETDTYIPVLKRLGFTALLSSNKFCRDFCFILLPYASVILMNISALGYNT